MLQRCQSFPERAREACEVLGLPFKNWVGLAAGVDRTGTLLSHHARSGVGHIEIGTVTDPRQLAVIRRAEVPGLVVGINFASARAGFDDEVIDDYAAVMQSLWPCADYLVANLSAPSAGRGGDTPGIEALLDRLSVEREDAIRRTGETRPLLIKVRAGECGKPLPRWAGALRNSAIQGVVLVSSFPERIEECRPHLGGLAIVSVGGIATARDAGARFEAGASLVQIYSSYIAEGIPAARVLLDGDDRS